MRQKLTDNKPLLDDLVRRRFIFCQSAEIYGGMAGLFDYGPIGTGVKNNLVRMWKDHFIIEEDLLELSCTTLTPRMVFKHSGHEDLFTDWMLKDIETGESFRADHLIEAFIDRDSDNQATPAARRAELNELRGTLPNFKSAAEFDAVIERYALRSPTGGSLGKVYAFNLMFECRMGPLGDQRAYLRPETAQSIFCNFKKLLDFNNGKLPFGAAIVGRAYRNEIAPRNGLLRVREFEMAEIEFFFDPQNSTAPKLSTVKDVALRLFTRELQQGGEPTILSVAEALQQGVLKSEILAYFLARTMVFATAIGLCSEMLRFRQHQAGEMAHYASDCWDLEVLTSYGWVECVGLADRAAYDLSAHARGSGEKLMAARSLAAPVQRRERAFVLEKGEAAKTFKGDMPRLLAALAQLSGESFDACEARLRDAGSFELEGFLVTQAMIKTVKEETRMVQEEKFVPHVIEPSFGISRLVYALLEHNFARRLDARRTFFTFNASIAPYKIVFLPLLSKDALVNKAEQLVREFRKAGVGCRLDAGSSAIGKRYSRTDEVGIPFAATIDFATLDDDTVTLREIDTTQQIRVPCVDLLSLVEGLARGTVQWSSLLERYPRHHQPDEAAPTS